MRSTQLKLRRAATQIRALEKELIEWSQSKPLITEGSLTDNNRTLTVRFTGYNRQPYVEEWGMQIGEIVHNLRSGLDNLAYDLALLHNKSPENPVQIKFPIVKIQSKFKRKDLGHFSVPVLDTMERIQPFQRDINEGLQTSNDDLLWLLNEASNSDKHRIPTVLVCAVHNQSWEGVVEEDCEQSYEPETNLWTGPLEPNCALLTYTTRNRIKSVKFQFKYTTSIHISFGDHVQPLIQLYHMWTFVNIITAEFKEFFPDMELMPPLTAAGF